MGTTCGFPPRRTVPSWATLALLIRRRMSSAPIAPVASFAFMRQVCCYLVEPCRGSARTPSRRRTASCPAYESKRAGAGAEDRDKHQQARDAAGGAELELLKAVASLNGMGIQLKGPLEGLIDFPSYRDGELVELCWKLGEERVEHWHHVGEGFAGRKKL